MTIGIVPSPMYQPSLASSAAAERLVAERLQPCRRDAQEVVPEVEDDRGHRAQLDDGGERSARVRPAEEGRDDPQVRR